MTGSMIENGNLQYGFGGRLSEIFPSQVIIDITEVCNLECIHCPHPQFKKSNYYGTRYLSPHLNRKIVDEVKEAGSGRTQYIRYSSEGEPLIHPNSYEMIEYAASNSGVFVTLTTNGTIMKEKRTKKLLESGVHMIDISIDAFRPETYAKIRKQGNLEVTTDNVLNLINWIRTLGSSTKVVVSFIEQQENAFEVKDFERFWNDNGADSVVIRKLHSAAGAVVGLADIMRNGQKSRPRRPCVYPWERIVLNPRGELAFCPADWTHGSGIANYETTTVYQTWNSVFYRQLRKAHLENDFRDFGFCGQCPDWEHTFWPDQHRTYADLVAEMNEK